MAFLQTSHLNMNPWLQRFSFLLNFHPSPEMIQVRVKVSFRVRVMYIRGFQPVVRGPPVVRGELPRGPRATREKLETRRILTKQKYLLYQWLQRT